MVAVGGVEGLIVDWAIVGRIVDWTIGGGKEVEDGNDWTTDESGRLVGCPGNVRTGSWNPKLAHSS